MATIKQFGIAGVGSDVQLGKNGGRLVYNSGAGRFDFFGSDGATLEVLRSSGIQLGTTTAVTSILDDDLLAADSNIALATQQSIKAYVDTKTNNGGMLTAGDSGSGAIIFATETFVLNGNVNNIVTKFVGTNSFLVSLRDDVIIDDTLLVGNITTKTGSITTETLIASVTGNVVTFNSLSGTGAVTVTNILDEDNMASDANSALATQQSIKAYVDNSLASGGLAMSVGGDLSVTDTITFASDTFNIFGTANQISSSLAADTFTLAIVNDFIAPGNITVTEDLTTSLTAASVPYIGTAGLLTEDGTNLTYNVTSSTFTTTNLTAGTIGVTAIGSTVISNILNENNLVSNSQTALATQASIKSYVDTEIDKVDVLTINADGATTSSVNLYTGQSLTVSGTANEIETGVSGQTVTIGLPNEVTVTGNLNVGGSLLSDDITSTAISINGDATVSGNLTVSGTTTVVNSTEVDITDAVIRVNSDGAVVSAGIEANVAGVIESVLYVPPTGWVLSGNIVTDDNLTVLGTADIGTVEFDNLSGTGAISVTDILDEDTLASDSPTALATQQSIKAYVDTTISGTTSAANLDVFADDGVGSINVFNEEFRINGGTNINTAVADGAGGNVLVINLDDSVNTGNITVTNNLQFTNLTDGVDTITAFITEADTIAGNDNDTSVPTTAAVIDFVDNNAGDGLVKRGAFTADSAANVFVAGTMPDVTSRTYYGVRVILDVSVAFSGGSVNHITLKDNDGAGSTLVAEADCDISTVGTYIVEQTAVTALTKGQDLVVQFLEVDGLTPAIPTAGQITVSTQYVWIS